MMLEESSKLLHQYPIIEMTVAALVGLATLLHVFRAEKQRRDLPPQAQMPREVQMFFDGPLKVAIDLLERSVVLQERMASTLARMEEQNRVEVEVNKSLSVDHKSSDRNRWNDIFEIAREIKEMLARLAEPRRGR